MNGTGMLAMLRYLKEAISLTIIIFHCGYTVKAIDKSYLIEQHLLTCGPNSLCERKLHGPYLNSSSYEGIDICPPCHCDTACLHRGDCCPDKFLGFPPQVCVNVTVIEAISDESLAQRSHYLMVNSCPNDADKSVKFSCEGNKDISFRLRNPPVTSSISSLSYANKFCAICNNDSIYEPWNLDINCSKPSDFNYLSTFEEIISQAYSDHCVFQAFPPNETMVHNCFRNKTLHFDACNKTGHWKTYDKDMESACDMHFYQSDKFFKNTFCRQCNPSARVVPLVSTCNTTGMWNPPNDDLQNACNFYKTSLATFPYKNVFCYFCNKNMSDSNHFQDVVMKNMTVEDFFMGNTSNTLFFHYYFGIEEMNLMYFLLKVNEILSEKYAGRNIWATHSDDMYTATGNKVNITSLVHKKISLTLGINVCDLQIIPEYFRKSSTTCSCDYKCLFSPDTCCEEMKLKYPGHCVSEMELSGPGFRRENETEYFLTDGCIHQNEYPDVFYRGCNKEMDDIFSLLPVSDPPTNVSFQNFYCLACNFVDWSKGLFPTHYDPWDIDILCEDFIEYDYFLLFGDLLKTLKTTDCLVKYHIIPKGKEKNELFPTFQANECTQNKEIDYTHCNQTENWPEFDENVNWACEQKSRGALKFVRGFRPYSHAIYKNYYCMLCNPKENVEITIHTCLPNFTTKYNERFCEYFPKIYYFYPFRNLQCLFCNGAMVSIGSGLTPDSGPPDLTPYKPQIPWLPVYRSLFAVTSDENYVSVENDVPECQSDQVYDKIANICRNITCYPGKMTSKDSCEPLFHYTNNLRYKLALQVTGNSTTFLQGMELGSEIKDIFSEELKERLLLTTNPVYKIDMQHNVPCFGLSPTISLQFKAHVVISIYIPQSVPRTYIERTLLEFTNSSFERTIKNIKFGLSLSKGVLNDIHVAMPLFGFHNTCMRSFEQTSVKDLLHYRLVKMSKVLLCKQLEVKAEEFIIDRQSNGLSLINHNYTYNFTIYDVLPNGNARICLEEFQPFLDDSEHLAVISIHTDLWVITLVCTIVSLICLLLTFLTYCLFPSLRTTPGKNNMAIVASLFLTQLLFQISRSFRTGDTFCTVFGVLLHYFWLMLFFYNSVACVHMYRLFHPELSIRHHITHKHTFLKYSVFSTASPLIICLTNVIVFYTQSEGSDIGYGTKKCFIDNSISSILSFVVPVGIVCISNVFFFVSTARNLYNRSNVKNNRDSTADYSAICRLFTITGISWLLQVIDGFLPFSAFTYMATLITALQGVFIFVAFVCTPKTLNLYKTAYHKKSLADSSYTAAKMVSSKTANSSNSVTFLSIDKFH